MLRGGFESLQGQAQVEEGFVDRGDGAAPLAGHVGAERAAEDPVH